ncbi:TPA: hypothetical protein HA249_01690 [Candidatus Woesearchaeota archaeon]|nr:hypothetical protein [Candidatus Woesearchaeota archaeon]HIH47944.1 hypothetical protein [Candidatus Woesearchaeota archaeon]
MKLSTENSALLLVTGVALVLMFSSFSNINSEKFTGNVANEPADDSLAENAVCQRDSQCQGVLVCRKLVSRQTNQFYGDKKCKPARSNGETCEAPNYCRSKQCGADGICKARSNLGANEYCDTNNECRSGYCDTTRSPGAGIANGRCGVPPGRNMRGSGSFCTADNDCTQPYICRPTGAARDVCTAKGTGTSDKCRDNTDCTSNSCTQKNAQGVGTCAVAQQQIQQEQRGQAVQAAPAPCEGYGLEQRPDPARYPKGIVCGPSWDAPRFERTVLFTTRDGVGAHIPDNTRASVYVYTSPSCGPRDRFTLTYNAGNNPAPQGHRTASIAWVTSRVDPTCSVAQQRSVGPRFQSSEIGLSFVPGTGGGCFVYEPNREQLSATFGGRQGSMCMICDNNPASQQDCFRMANNARQAGLI